jgi:hypothetical protein|tara:strand:+ start:2588 stop:2836 length:249 start_codon:yes stop_codon:yes gene_type:complete
MKQSNPKTFTNLASGSAKPAGKNSGIFTEPQRAGAVVKPSVGKSANRAALATAMAMPAKKSISGGGVTAEAVRATAMKTGRK